MAITADILDRKETHFVLWRPGKTASRAPELVIGTLKTGNPPEFAAGRKQFTMTPADGLPDLWQVPASDLPTHRRANLSLLVQSRGHQCK
jgi:pullulanase